MSNWTKCSERLPEPGVAVLAWDGTYMFRASVCDEGDWWDDENQIKIEGYEPGVLGDQDPVTHWTPLPEPPQEEEP